MPDETIEAKVSNHEVMLQVHEQQLNGLCVLTDEIKRVDSDVKRLSIDNAKIVSHLESIDHTLKDMRAISADNRAIAEENRAVIELLKNRMSSMEVQKRTISEVFAVIAPPVSYLVIALIVAYLAIFDSQSVFLK